MKKNIINFLSTTKLLLLLVMLACAGCPPEPDRTPSGGGSGTGTGTGTSVTYKFSAPVRVTDFGSNVGGQNAFVTPNHVYKREIIGAESYSRFFYKDNVEFYLSFLGELTSVYGTGRSRGLDDILTQESFCVDKNDKFFYALILKSDGYFCLYKCDISSLSTVSYLQFTAMPIADNITPPGEGSFMKVMNNGDLLFSSSENGGSVYILKSGSTAPIALVTNLGAVPAAIDVYNNEIYFTLNLSTGSVQKVSSSNKVSTVIENLTNPYRLVFDNNGNMVIETKTTIDGADYGKYTIYTNSGKKITDISDAQNILILSAWGAESNVPLYIDNYNNLYFGHSAYNTASISHCNPVANSGTFYENLNIYKMQLIKQ